MSAERPHKRKEERKFKRISIRYGLQHLEHKATAQQISPSGFFVSTNTAVFANNSPLVVEIAGPAETWLVTGIVRHAVKVHPSLIHSAKPGMGVELTNLPPACRAYLASL